jgi:hypothetical protein
MGLGHTQVHPGGDWSSLHDVFGNERRVITPALLLGHGVLVFLLL